MHREPTVLVVGAGISGSMAAVASADSGVKTILVSLDIPARSSSSCITEGVAAALRTPDSFDEHIADSTTAAKGLASCESIEQMVRSAPKLIHLLYRMGVNFARNCEGGVRQYRSIGSSSSRVAFAEPSLSRGALNALHGQLLRLESEGKLELHFGYEFMSPIVLAGGECAGIVACDVRKMEVKTFVADAVVMCAGGCESVFERSTGSLYCDGSALYSCHESGAALANLEMIQFHPFTIPFGMKNVALSDLLFEGKVNAEISGDPKKTFGIEGGRIFGLSGIYKEDAAAEICKRSMQSEGEPFSILKFEKNEKNSGADALRALRGYERYFSADPFEEGLRVVPSAHRALGGLAVDAKHHTTVAGLFAAGHIACAYHGGGCIGGNEMLSSLYGGLAAGREASAHARHIASLRGEINRSVLDAARAKETDSIASAQSARDGSSPREIAGNVRAAMSSGVGVLRDAGGLGKAVDALKDIVAAADAASISDRSAWFNQQVFELIRVRKMARLASLIAASALARRESRGAHVRTDALSQDRSPLYSVVKNSSGVELKSKVF